MEQEKMKDYAFVFTDGFTGDDRVWGTTAINLKDAMDMAESQKRGAEEITNIATENENTQTKK